MAIDIDQSRQQLLNKTVDNIKQLFPLETDKFKLVLDDVTYKMPEYIDPKDEAEAKKTDKSISFPVVGHFSLYDARSGEKLESKKVQLMKLPMITDRGTFVVGGNEYNVVVQNRRRPGIYPIVRETGETEAEFNIAKGLASGMGIRLNPEEGVFKVRIGTANKYLYPILSAVGVDDKTLEKTWGKELLEKNRTSQTVYKSTILDFARRITGREYSDLEKAKQAIKDQFAKMEMEAEVNQKTIGRPDSVVHPETLINATKSILAVTKGEKQPIDRNSIVYKKFYWVDDFIPERTNLHFRKIKEKIKSTLNKQGTLSKSIAPNVFTKPIEDLFTNTSLAELGSQHNPIDMLSQFHKITATGEGGIQNLQVVKEEARALSNSHFAFIDPIQTPESEKIGLNLQMALGTNKKGNKLYSPFIDFKTGKAAYLAHDEIEDKVVAFPSRNWDPNKKKFKSKVVTAIKNGKIVKVPAAQVDYVFPSPQLSFSFTANMVPFLNANSGARMFMATKHLTQAISLIDREQPLIKVGTGKNNSTTVEKFYSQLLRYAPSGDGVVTKVTDSLIEIKIKDPKTGKDRIERIPIYKNFPLNNKHFLHTEAVYVKPGDKVKKGQRVIDNNFTKDGELALGTNLKVAYLADGGYNFEDGITISESAAKKLTSQHLYDMKFQTKLSDKTIERNPKKYMSYFPGKINLSIAKKLDEDGVVKPGQIIKKGEPLVLGVRKSTAREKIFTGKAKSLKTGYKDHSLYWDKDVDGEVVDVVKTSKGVRVYVKTKEQAVIADKLAGRYGNKGVITRILPDDKMPRDKNGEPFDILLNPATVPSRINPGQLMETALAKVAKKTGQPMVIKSFDHEKDYNKWVRSVLKKHGFDPSGEEEVFDADGTKLGKVLTGYQYTIKLSKQAKTNYSARSAGIGERYDSDRAPAKGSHGSAKALDLLSFYGMLSHGALANLREMATDKASQNDQFWELVANGQPLPAPKPTFAYQKFTDLLKVAGVNIKRSSTDPDYLQIVPVTDEDVLKISRGKVEKPVFIRGKNLQPIRKGFLDPKIFGDNALGSSMEGYTNWGHIELSQPVINPVFKNSLMHVLGYTDKTLNKKLGDEGINALINEVRALDLDKMEEELTRDYKKTKNAQTKSQISRRLKYVKALKASGKDPVSVYFQKNVPVLPVAYRPIIAQEDRNMTVSGLNYLYRDIMLVNQALADVENIPYVSKDLKAGLRKDLQASVESLAGIHDPLGNWNKLRQPKGIVQVIKGNKAKEGFFQRKVLRRTQDLTGRGVITPDPKLSIDEVGLPEDMAWKIYEPFVRRNLRQAGYTSVQALKAVKERTNIAKQMLEKEMKERPIMLNRPPSLHKFSFLAFTPHLVPGKTIKIPSMVVKGFNADFDGDAMIVHVPVRKEAVVEAKRKIMASKNLFNPRDNTPLVVPSKESNVGLYRASKDPKWKKRLQEILPQQYHEHIKQPLDGKGIQKLFTALAQNENPESYKQIARKLKLLGDEVAFKTGFTVSIKDLISEDPHLEKIRKNIESEVKKAKNDKEINNILAKHSEEIDKLIMDKFGDNAFVEMVKSKGAGKINQIKQIIGMPVQYTDENKQPIPVPITDNFSRGMDMDQYWVSLFAARRGMIERKMETADPGAFAKKLLVVTSRYPVSVDADEIPETDGELFDITDKDIYDRYLAKDLKDKNGNIIAKKGDLITSKKTAEWMKKGIKQVPVFTILSDPTPFGVHSRAYGILAEGRNLEKGDNVGTLAGQALAEPLQQGAMNTFHTGGTAEGGDVKATTGYKAIKQMIELPSIIPEAAAISLVEGTVTKIEKAPAGGQFVYIGDHKHFVRPGQSLMVKKGDKVTKAQPLSKLGIKPWINPKEYLEVTGDVDKTRLLMLEQLRAAYADTGTKVHRRNLEVIVKSLTDTAQVIDSNDPEVAPGSIVSYDWIRWRNAQKPFMKPANDDNIVGFELAQDVGSYKKGTIITANIAEDLEKMGDKPVTVKYPGIKVKPVLYGAEQIPVKSGDVFTHMGYGYIERAIKERMAEETKIPIHGVDPIPAFAYGSEIGTSRKSVY